MSTGEKVKRYLRQEENECISWLAHSSSSTNTMHKHIRILWGVILRTKIQIFIQISKLCGGQVQIEYLGRTMTIVKEEHGQWLKQDDIFITVKSFKYAS